MKRRLKLSTQIGLAIVAVGIFELLLVVGVVMVRLYVLDQSWLNGLDEPTRQAVHLMDKGGPMSAAQMAAAIQARQKLTVGDATDILPMMGWLTLLALGSCVGGGLAFGHWLARPLAAVAGAAREVAQGDLDARAATSAFASADTARLVEDFNTMAEGLQRSDREIRESTAAIAHELRTPLTVLRGRLHGLADGVFRMEPAEIPALLKQVEALGRIVEDLRTVSLADAGKLELQTSDIDLAEEARSVADACRAPFAAQGIELELDLRPAPVMGDGDRLRQALLAALENGRRHAATGKVLRIETALDGGFGVLRVLDRGPGLSEEASRMAFTRFWRSDPSRSRETGGSGLGLSVLAAIASAHGGEVSLTNRSGGGAQLELRLPA
jgi:two-component system sensor histidine kinase AdeS